MTVASKSTLGDTLLQECRRRAAGYDRENRFCQEDFDELKAAGYLRMAIPKEFGGFEFTLAEAGRETRRLANHARATALCINIHHAWVRTAADVWRSGDKSVEWILQEAAAGEVFAAGHAESGNETTLFASTTKAERVPGGYRFTGCHAQRRPARPAGQTFAIRESGTNASSRIVSLISSCWRSSPGRSAASPTSTTDSLSA